MQHLETPIEIDIIKLKSVPVCQTPNLEAYKPSKRREGVWSIEFDYPDSGHGTQSCNPAKRKCFALAKTQPLTMVAHPRIY